MKLATFTLSASLACGQSYYYDEADRLIRSTTSDGQATLFVYDDADNLLSVSNQQVPKAPGDFRAERTSATRVTLTWTDLATTEIGYRIERRPLRGYQWQAVRDLPADATSYQDPVPMDQSFVYRVLALGTNDLPSAYSAPLLATAQGSQPLSIRSVRGQNRPDSPFEFRFLSEVGVVYQLEVSENLTESSWTTTAFSLTPGGEELTSVIGNGMSLRVFLSISPTKHRFYRLRR